MLSEAQINDLVMRTKRYPFSDGLADFAMAALWLVSGIISWVIFDQGLAKSDAAVLALMVIPVTVIVTTRPIMTFVRSRWLWRESGWVEPRGISVPRWVLALSMLVWIGSVLISYALAGLGIVDDWFLMHMFIVSMGWFCATYLIASGLHLKLRRYTIAGMVGALAVTSLLFTSATFGQSMLINGLVWGVLLIITGLLTLRRTLMQLEAAA